jgi:hypothetical protein
MNASTSFLTDSKYYSPIFNSAIYDGPFRIYFSQHQESLGLKVYFAIQHQHNDFYKQMKDSYKQTGEQIFILLYPTQESYEMAFPNGNKASILLEHVEDNSVFGVLTVDGDVQIQQLTSKLRGLAPLQPQATI